MALLAVLAFGVAGVWASGAVAASPDFSITATAHQSVYPGQAGVYTVSITPLNGFSGSVTLSVSGLPSGATGTFVTNPLTPSHTSTSMIVNVGSSVAQANYTLTITGTSGSLSHSVSPAPSLAVVPASGFTLAAGAQSPSPVVEGSSATYLVSATRLSGFSGAITFSTNSDLPAGVTAAFSPNPTSTSGTSSTLTLSVAGSVPVGSYPFAINGVNGGHTTWVQAMLVVSAPTPDFSLSATSSGPLYPTDATVITVSMSPLNGFSGNVALSVSGLPKATAATFVTNPLTTSKPSTSVIVTAGSAAPLGSYTLTFTGTSGSLTHTATATLTITSPTSFYLTVAPGENTGVAPGSAASFLITPKRLSGFTGAVTLSAIPDLPTGVTASFSPNPNSSGASTLTLQTSASTPLGSYPLAVKGVNGSTVTWDSVTLDVGTFGVTVTPASRTVADAGTGHTSSTTYSVTISRNTFSDDVSLSVSGLPSGATGSFSPNPVAGPSGTSSTLTITNNTAAQGSYTLTVSGTGGSPAQTHSQQVTLVIDTTAPVTMITFPANNGNYNAAGWLGKCLVGPTTGICGSATDPAGVTAVKVAIRNGLAQYWNGSNFVASGTPIFNPTGATPASWTYGFTPPGDGPYTVLVQATDGVGNTTLSGFETTASFKYDNVAPTTTLATIPASADGTNGWFKQASVQFTLSATDATSGVQASFYKIDAGSFQTYTGAVTINSQGDHTVQYYSQDNAGNTESQHTAHIKLDNVAPSTTLTLTPTNPTGSGGWYDTTPSFTLSATDATSGVYQKYYRIDGGTQTLYTGAVNVPDGQHTISYWSVDNAGNTEAAHTSGTIKVDTVSPSTDFSINPASPNGSNGWYKPPSPTFTLTASDTTSGVAHSYYQIGANAQQTYTGSAVTLPDGQYTVKYWSVDNAGNTEAAHTSGTIKVDTVSPSTSIALNPTSPNGSNGWYDTTPAFTLSAGDVTSGVAATYYKIDSGTQTLYTSAVNIPDGSHTVSYWSVDNAGNTEATHTTATIKVDTVAPSTAFSINPPSPNGLNGWYKAPSPTFTLTGNDSNSGVAHSYYEINGGAQQTYPGSPVTLPDGGAVTVTYWSVDAAGNVEGSHTAGPFKIDTQAPPQPTISTHPSDPSNQPTASFTFTDTEAGVSFRCWLDTDPFAACADPQPQTYTGLPQGGHTFRVEAEDEAGNISSAASFGWTIAAQPYTIGAGAIGTLYPGGHTRPIDLTFTNPNGDTVKVSSLSVAISSITDPHGHEISELNGGSGTCSTSNYQVTQFSGSSPFYIPAGTTSDFDGSNSAHSLGYTNTAKWPQIQMLDNGDQDACKGATVHLSFTGNS